MDTREAASAQATIGAAGIAAVLLLSAWCAPALASSGIKVRCDQTREATLPDASIPAATTTLAAHTESALQDILDDDAITVPALAEATAEKIADDGDEVDTAEETVIRSSETPAMTTRLPGVSSARLPSFRRQMLRTDI